MSEYLMDPFEKVRKNAHIWRGENAIIWYNEKLDGSFTVLVLYNFGDKNRRLFLEIGDKNQIVGFKNDELPKDLYLRLVNEIEVVEGFTKMYQK